MARRVLCSDFSLYHLLTLSPLHSSTCLESRRFPVSVSPPFTDRWFSARTGPLTGLGPLVLPLSCLPIVLGRASAPPCRFLLQQSNPAAARPAENNRRATAEGRACLPCAPVPFLSPVTPLMRACLVAAWWSTCGPISRVRLNAARGYADPTHPHSTRRLLNQGWRFISCRTLSWSSVVTGTRTQVLLVTHLAVVVRLVRCSS